MGRTVKQGDVYQCSFRSPDKRRPVLILTRDSAISFLTSITVAPITTTVRRISSEVALTPDDDGVFNNCAINVDRSWRRADGFDWIDALRDCVSAGGAVGAADLELLRRRGVKS